MAKKKVAAPESTADSTPAAAPPAPPAPAPAPKAPKATAAPAPEVSTPDSKHEAGEAPGAPIKNRTEAKLLKELESLRKTIVTTFSDLDKVKSELKEQKSATRRPRSVRVSKRPAEVEVA